MKSIATPLLVWAITTTAGAAGTPAVTAGGMSDITVLSVDIGHFSYGQKIIHVFENSRNIVQFPNNPEKWQFMIEPIMALIPSSTGGFEFSEADLDPLEKTINRKAVLFNRYRVKIPLHLISETAVNKAIEVVYARYPESRCKVGPQNIDVLPLVTMDIRISDVDEAGRRFHETSRIHTKRQSFLTSPNVSYLLFDVWERDRTAKHVEDKAFIRFIPFMSIEASLSFSVKSTTFNITSGTVEKLKNTELYAKLKGDGSDAYVTREDLRQLTNEAATQLKTIQIIEDRANFDEALFRELINGAKAVSADESFFDDERGQHTYNADDLKPSVIEEQLNKMFDYDSGTDKHKIKADASGGGSFLGIIKGNAKGSYSSDELHEFLKKHSVETKIVGKLIKVKSIDLVRLNISKLIDKSNFGSEYRNIESGSPKSGLTTEIFGDLVSETSKSFKDLTAECKDKQATIKLDVR